jgi:hypothetical protein
MQLSCPEASKLIRHWHQQNSQFLQQTSISPQAPPPLLPFCDTVNEIKVSCNEFPFHSARAKK